MTIPAKKALGPTQDKQRQVAVQNLGLGLKSTLVPLGLIAIVWFLYTGRLEFLTCTFKDKPLLLGLWPPNFIYLENFSQSNYSLPERCWFFAMTSSASLIWFFWMIWRVVHESLRTDTFYVSPALKLFCSVTLVYAIVVPFHPFTEHYDSLIPSTRQSISTGAVKVMIFISLLYVLVAMSFEQFLLYRRSDKNVIAG